MKKYVLIILVIAFIFRLMHILSIHFSPLGSYLFIDSEVYDTWARDILKNGVIGTRPFYQDPLYPYYLALLFTIFGHNLFIVRLIQIITGTLTCYLFYQIANLLFDDKRVNLTSALIAATYIPFIFCEGEIEKTGLAILLTTLFIWLFLMAYKNKLNWVLPGITLGFTVLVRNNIFIIGVSIIILLFFWKNYRALITFACAFFIPITLVVVRNSILAKELTFTTTAAGQCFYIGNGPYNNSGQYTNPPWVRPHPYFEEEDFRNFAQQKLEKKVRTSEVGKFYFKLTFSFIKNNPGKFLILLLKKILFYFNNYEIPDNQDISFIADYSPILKFPIFRFGLIFALAIVGFISMWRQKIGYLIWAGFFIFALSIIVFFISARYRMPAITFIIPYASCGLWQLGNSFKKRIWKDITKYSLIFTGVLAFTLIPLKSEEALRLSRAQDIANLATRYCQEGKLQTAIDLYHKALIIAPNYDNALRDLGVVYLLERNYKEAEKYLSRCLEINPNHADANFFLGKVYQEEGRLQEAVELYKKAQEIWPGNLEISFNLANILQNLGRIEESIKIYEAMLKIVPENGLIYHNLSVAYYNLKNYNLAKLYLDKAKSLGLAPNPLYEKALNEASKR